MPIYEYRCEQGHTFEVMRRMTDDPLRSCETCSAPVERVFRPIAVHFKGSGFYATDYGSRKSAREREAGEGGGEQAKAEGSKEPKSGQNGQNGKDGSSASDSKGSEGSRDAKDSKSTRSESATSSTSKSSSSD